VGAALAINGVTRRRTIGADAAIGVVTTASFARGRARFAVFGRPGTSFDAARVGSILGVSRTDVLVIAGVAVVVAAAVFLQYRPLLFTTFDPDVAQASGVRTAWVEALLMLALAVTILSTMKVLGVTLIAATIVVPAVIARMLTDSFGRLLVYATVVGALSGAAGMNLSYHADVQSGPTIVLVGAALFTLVFAWSSLRAAVRRRPGALAS
jgi:manganese/iron transport system permease protein/iron/zinc/copper transport system permease protein